MAAFCNGNKRKLIEIGARFGRLAIALAVGIFLVGMLVYASIMHVGGMPIEILP